MTKPYIIWADECPEGGREVTGDSAWSLAIGRLQREYDRWIKSAAESVLDDYEGSDEYDAIHEQADGTYWVICTSAAHQVWFLSDNESAWEDAGAEAPTAEVRAYYAVAADIREAVAELRDERASEGDE